MTSSDKLDTTSFALLGVDSLDKIAKDDVVTYYVGKNDKIVRVEVSKNTITGTVTKITSDDDYYINGTAYACNAAGVKVGSEGTFYLDYAGDIYAFEGVTKTANYAIALKDATYYAGTGAYASGTVAVKLFTAAGEKVTYDIDEDVVINGTTVSSINTTAGAAGLVAADKLVEYTLDKDGVIDSLTVLTTTTNSGMKYYAKGVLDSKEIADNVVVFSGNAGSYSVAKLADIPVDKGLTATIYYEDAEDGIVVIITNEASTGTYGVITEVGTVENADKDNVYEVVMLVDGKSVTYTTKKITTTITTMVEQPATSLYAITLDGGLLNALDAQPATNGIVTDSGIKDGFINIGTGFKAVSDNVVVYEMTKNSKEAFKVMAAAEFADINDGDEVWLYDVDDDEAGVDIIVFWAN